MYFTLNFFLDQFSNTINTIELDVMNRLPSHNNNTKNSLSSIFFRLKMRLGVSINHLSNAEVYPYLLFKITLSSCTNFHRYRSWSIHIPWLHHQMETFSALLAICAGNSPVHGEFPAQRPVTRSFDVYFNMHPNKRLSKQSRGWWFAMPSRSLWRQCNAW